MSTWTRFLRFNAVSALGIGVQLSVLWLLTTAGVGYLAATTIAVATAVVHNFAWHRQWTWADRDTHVVRAFLSFAAGNGAVSLATNLVVMTGLVSVAGMTPVPANLIAIGSDISDARVKAYRNTNVFADQAAQHLLHSSDHRIQIDHHGLLNLLAAVVFGDEEAALAETDAEAFALDAGSFRWRGRTAGAAELAAARGRFHAIGSCSFFEPVEELEALGVLPL